MYGVVTEGGSGGACAGRGESGEGGGREGRVGGAEGDGCMLGGTRVKGGVWVRVVFVVLDAERVVVGGGSWGSSGGWHRRRRRRRRRRRGGWKLEVECGGERQGFGDVLEGTNHDVNWESVDADAS
jgi:hypothetical protein